MDSQNKSISQEIERKTQEIYSARNTIDSLTVSVQHLEYENTELKAELADEKQKREEAEAALKSKCIIIDNNRQQLSDLGQDLERERASNDHNASLEKEVQRLKSQLERVKSTAHVIPTNTEEEEEPDFELQIAQLLMEKDNLQLKLTEAVRDIETKMSVIANLQYDVKEKDEELEGCQCEYQAQCNITECLREEIRELKVQLESESAPLDTNKKGNSLFAEVEDRRVAAEKRTVLVEEQFSSTKEKLAKSETEIRRLKKEILFLRQSANKGYDHSLVKDLQNQLQESKKTVIDLTEKLNKKTDRNKSSITKEHKPSVVVENGAQDGTFVNYLRVVIADKEKEIKELKTTASREHIQMLHTDLHLVQARNDMTTLQHEKDQLKVTNANLAMEIRNLQHKYEPEKFAELKANSTYSEGQPQKSTALNDKTKVEINLPDSSKAVYKKESISSKRIPSSNLKENKTSIISGILSGNKEAAGHRKGVQMFNTVNVVSADGEVKTTELDTVDKSGKKIKRSSSNSGTGKYKSITVCNDDEEEAAECKQQ